MRRNDIVKAIGSSGSRLVKRFMVNRHEGEFEVYVHINNASIYLSQVVPIKIVSQVLFHHNQVLLKSAKKKLRLCEKET